MGRISFDVPEIAGSLLDERSVGSVHVCGIEGVPFASRVHVSKGRWDIEREVGESGKVSLVADIPTIGRRLVTTCSLRSDVDTPYQLPLEIARGLCHSARMQSDGWHRAGLQTSTTFEGFLRDGSQAFMRAAAIQGDHHRCAEASIQAIVFLQQAIDELADLFSTQSIAFRRRRQQPITTLIAATFNGSGDTSATYDKYASVFNAASVPLNWADIETDSGRFDFDAPTAVVNELSARGLRLIGGPLIDFRPRMLPHWLYLLEDNVEEFARAASQYVERVVNQFAGRMQLWNIVAGLNTSSTLKLTDEQAMRVSIAILTTVRRCDPNTPVVMSLDQPFGNYLAKQRDGISPLHFADALVRSGLGLAGIGLEMRFQYEDHASPACSAIQLGNLIDRWATLGLPLLVQMAAPSSLEMDPQAQTAAGLVPYSKQSDIAKASDPGQAQLELVGPMIKMILSKPVVHGIIWEGWSDRDRHANPHAGMLDKQGQPRPLLNYFEKVRREYFDE